MIDVDELSVCMTRRKVSKADCARMCGVAPKTFYNWLDKRSMPTDKAELLIAQLRIPNPAPIFFNGELPDK